MSQGHMVDHLVGAGNFAVAKRTNGFALDMLRPQSKML
jgi:hypothetical protein